MNNIKKYWKEILLGLLILFSLNKCTVACNRDSKIDKQQVELIQKDSIIKIQTDSLNLFKVRWDENQKGQDRYENLAAGTKQDLLNQISIIENEKNILIEKNNKLEKENANLKRENKQLKEQINLNN